MRFILIFMNKNLSFLVSFSMKHKTLVDCLFETTHFHFPDYLLANGRE